MASSLSLLPDVETGEESLGDIDDVEDAEDDVRDRPLTPSCIHMFLLEKTSFGFDF